MAKQNQQAVSLDITHLSSEFIWEHFPTIAQKCKEQGIDVCTEWVPVALAAHYACGGVRTDEAARTDC